MKTLLDTANIGIELALKLLIVGVLGYALISPDALIGRFSAALERTGVEVTQLTIFGVQMRVRLSEAPDISAAIGAQGAELEELRRYNDELLTLVNCQRDNECSETQISLVEELAGGVDSPVEESAVIYGEGSPRPPVPAAPAIPASEPAVIEPAAIEIAPAAAEQLRTLPPAAWMVVVGADTTLEAAEFEKRRLDTLGHPTEILKRGRFFRTVARFTTQGAALQAQDAIAGLMGRQVYALRMASWCPDPSPRDGYLVCGDS